MEIYGYHGLILQIACRPLSPPRHCSACPYLPESALQGCPCPAPVPLCQTFISRHPDGSVTQHKHSSVTRREVSRRNSYSWLVITIQKLHLLLTYIIGCGHILYVYTCLPASCSKMSLEKVPSGRSLLFLPVNVPWQMQMFHTRPRNVVLRTVLMVLFLFSPGDAMSTINIKVVSTQSDSSTFFTLCFSSSKS